MDSALVFLYLTLAYLAWLISIMRGTILYNYYWQLKEYRWDRMQEFLTSKRGKSMIFSSGNFFRIFLFVLLAVYFSSQDKRIVLAGFIALILWSAFLLFQNYKKGTLYRPKPTLRMIITLAGCLLAEIGIFVALKGELVWILVFEMVRPFLVSLVNKLVGIPFGILKISYIERAKLKRKNKLLKLKVIGITGSYGKSSTKEFLAKILESKFSVAKTPKHVNVDVGIARTLLNSVSTEDIFIAEMGAYCEGEIESSANIIKPNIGILTGINEQHLSFFGHIENTIKTKAELFASLPKDGIAIVNADSREALQALDYNNADKVIKYSIRKEEDVYATSIKQEEHVMTFKVHAGTESADFELPVLGKQYVQNLLGVVACALEFGMSLKEIAEYAKSCTVLDGSLQIFEGIHGAIIADDSYNSNPDGFEAALSTVTHLKPNRVILVTPGMLELGKKSEELHTRIGHMIGEFCDEIYITSEDNYEVLNNSICEVSKKAKVYLETDHKMLLKNLRAGLKKGDLVLFENRVPSVVIDKLKK